ncbi:MAG: hypothetical protein ACTHK7_21945 [Aureliella sp.]
MSANPFAPPPGGGGRAPSMWALPLCGSLILFGELVGCAATLFGFYISARYPAILELVRAALDFSK